MSTLRRMDGLLARMTSNSATKWMEVWHYKRVITACTPKHMCANTEMTQRIVLQAGSFRVRKHKRSGPKAQLTASQAIADSFSTTSQLTPHPLSPTTARHPSSTPPLQHRACASASCDLGGLKSFPTRARNLRQAGSSFCTLNSSPEAFSCRSFDANADLFLRPPLGPSAFDCMESPKTPFASPVAPPRPAAPFHDPDSPSYTAVLPLPHILHPPLHAPQPPATPTSLDRINTLMASQRKSSSSTSSSSHTGTPMLPPSPHTCPHAPPPQLPADAAPADAAYSRRCQKVLQYMRTHSAATVRSHIAQLPSPDSVLADLTRCCMHGLWDELQSSLLEGPSRCSDCVQLGHGAAAVAAPACGAADWPVAAADFAAYTEGVPMRTRCASAGAADDCCHVAMTHDGLM